jgi:hypothetical protein
MINGLNGIERRTIFILADQIFYLILVGMTALAPQQRGAPSGVRQALNDKSVRRKAITTAIYSSVELAEDCRRRNRTAAY